MDITKPNEEFKRLVQECYNSGDWNYYFMARNGTRSHLITDIIDKELELIVVRAYLKAWDKEEEVLNEVVTRP